MRTILALVIAAIALLVWAVHSDYVDTREQCRQLLAAARTPTDSLVARAAKPASGFKNCGHEFPETFR